MMLSMVEGRRKRGRPRIKWMDGIKDLTGLNLAELREAVRERQQWRNRTMDITRSRTRLGGTRCDKVM